MTLTTCKINSTHIVKFSHVRSRNLDQPKMNHPKLVLIPFQSQGMRVIEASTDQFNLTGGQRSIYQKIDRTVAENEKEEVDYGIPWTTHDAFGMLLQVS